MLCYVLLGYLEKNTEMKANSVLWVGLVSLLLLILTVGCGSQKEVTERRNFMMPKKSEMSRNSRYKEVEKRKTNKAHQVKNKQKSLF
jgi:hypothetical protein